MQQRKCFIDGLIQLTIFLSLIGVRVDVDSYLNRAFSSRLIDTDGGPVSSFIQPLIHRDTATGHHVHPKCLQLNEYFLSRRLLDKVRALGSPVRFPTQLSAWLVHQVPDGSEPEGTPNNDEESTTETYSSSAPKSLSFCQESSREANSTRTEEEIVKDNEEGIDLHLPTQQIQNLAQETLSSNVQQQTEGETAVHAEWPDFLSDFNDFESLTTQYVPEMDPIGYNASLQDAMFSSGRNCTLVQPSGANTTADQMSFFSLESVNLSSTDSSRTNIGALALPPFSSVGSSFHGTSHYGVGGYLDEAVFEQIHLLGLEGQTSVERPALNVINGSLDTPWLEKIDSDSGLSLETNSRSPASVSMSSSDSFFEGGATGYSSEVESLLSYGGPCASSSYDWPQKHLNKKIWHDHNYSTKSADGHDPQSWNRPSTSIKQEVMSEDETGLDEPSRDEQHLQALGLPFSASEIVNMPVEDFLELLEGRDLPTSEVTLLRDVRRRGKNKLAAQNCRKRKLHAILDLQVEVKRLVVQRDALLCERSCTSKALTATAECFKKLSHVVLRQLTDEHGQSLSPEQYTLHYGAHGRIAVKPRTNAARITTRREKTTKKKKDKKP